MQTSIVSFGFKFGIRSMSISSLTAGSFPALGARAAAAHRSVLAGAGLRAHERGDEVLAEPPGRLLFDLLMPAYVREGVRTS